jgi:hypothetical protein
MGAKSKNAGVKIFVNFTFRFQSENIQIGNLQHFYKKTQIWHILLIFSFDICLVGYQKSQESVSSSDHVYLRWLRSVS